MITALQLLRSPAASMFPLEKAAWCLTSMSFNREKYITIS